MIQVIHNKHNIMDAFSPLKKGKHVISIVGAGGKTSLLYAMAEWFEKQGKKTIVTTSTHIYPPKEAFRMDVLSCWKQNKYAVIGKKVKNKLEFSEILSLYISRADIVLIEADGSKHKPCKIPNKNEPVILKQTDCVIGVIGLSALQKPIQEVCFRVDEICSFLNKEKEDVLTVEDVIKMIQSEVGLKKGCSNRDFYVVLNQCDGKKELEYAQEIMKGLQENTIVSCLKEG